MIDGQPITVPADALHRAGEAVDSRHAFQRVLEYVAVLDLRPVRREHLLFLLLRPLGETRAAMEAGRLVEEAGKPFADQDFPPLTEAAAVDVFAARRMWSPDPGSSPGVGSVAGGVGGGTASYTGGYGPDVPCTCNFPHPRVHDAPWGCTGCTCRHWPMPEEVA